MSGKDIYDRMLVKYGYPKSRNLRNLFETVFPQEEAEIFMEMPAGVGEIAGKLDRDQETIRARLDNMASKGTVMRRPGRDGLIGYAPIPTLEMFCDIMMYSLGPDWDEENHELVENGENLLIAELWHKFFEEEWYRFSRTDELIHRRVEMFGGPEAGLTFTVTPAWKALEKCKAEPPADPGYDLRHVARQVKAAGQKIAAAACSCKVRAGKSKAPIYTCGSYREDMMPRYWKHHPRRIYKTWDPDEWLEMMGVCEEEFGLVHVGLPPQLYDVCTCDTECCNIFTPLKTYAHCYEGVEKSPYWAVVDSRACQGRGDCVKRCRFEAVKMTRNPDTGKNTAVINYDRCAGCGQCVLGCETKEAIRLELRS